MSTEILDPQLTMYQMAAQQVIGRDVDTLTLYHLNSLTPVTVPAHSDALEDKVRETVVDVAKAITKGDFDPKPDARGHCQWCDYVQVCPAFVGKKVPLSLKPNIQKFSSN